MEHARDYKTGLRPSVCTHSHGRISWSIFTELGADVRTCKIKKRVRWRSTSHHPFPHFAPKKPL